MPRCVICTPHAHKCEQHYRSAITHRAQKQHVLRCLQARRHRVHENLLGGSDLGACDGGGAGGEITSSECANSGKKQQEMARSCSSHVDSDEAQACTKQVCVVTCDPTLCECVCTSSSHRGLSPLSACRSGVYFWTSAMLT